MLAGIFQTVEVFVTCFEFVLCFTAFICPKLPLSYDSARLLSEQQSHGHYEGSCLRSDETAHVFFFCKQNSFCGNIKRVDSVPKQPRNTAKVQFISTFHQINSVFREVLPEMLNCQTFAAKDPKDCDLLEGILMSEDANDCQDVNCGVGVCVDRFRHHECLLSNGTTRVNENCSQIGSPTFLPIYHLRCVDEVVLQC